MAVKAFLSYRDADAPGHAGRLHDALETRLGTGCVYKFKEEARQAGTHYLPRILEAIAESEWVLVVIGPSWLYAADPQTGRPRLTDPYDLVRLEVATALEHGKRVVPVLVDDAPMPSASDLPTGLEQLAYHEAFMVSDNRWQTDVAHLIEAMTATGLSYAEQAAQLASSGKREAAKRAYLNAYQSGHPEAAPRAWIGLASLLYREGDKQRAESMFKQAISESQNPDHVALAELHFGWCLQEAGRLAQAEEYLNQARQTVRDSAQLLRVIDAQLEYVRWRRRERRKSRLQAGGLVLALVAATIFDKGDEQTAAASGQADSEGESGSAA